MIRWRPDTCGCIFEYEHDGAVPFDATFVRAVTLCDAHRHLDPESARRAVEDENRGKNVALAHVEDQARGRAADVLWYFDDARRVHLVLPSDLPTPAREAVRRAVDTARVLID